MADLPSHLIDLVCEDLKELIQEFQAKALFHCKEIIDEALGPLARNENGELDSGYGMRSCRTGNSHKKTPIMHKSMFELEASMTETMLFRKANSRKVKSTCSSGSVNSERSETIGRRCSLVASPSPTMVRKVREKASDGREDAAESSRRSDEDDKVNFSLPIQWGSGQERTPTNPLRFGGVSFGPDVSPSHRRARSTPLASGQQLVPPNIVSTEDSEDIGYQPSRGQRIETGASSNNLAARAQGDSPRATSPKKSVTKCFEPKPNDGLLDFEPVRPCLRTKSNQSTSNPKVEVANLDRLQRNLNKKLTSRTPPKLPPEEPLYLEGPPSWPQAQMQMALEREPEPSSDDDPDSDSDVDVRSPLLLKIFAICPPSSESRWAKVLNLCHYSTVVLLIVGCIAYFVCESALVVRNSEGMENMVIEAANLILSVGALWCYCALAPLQRNNNEMLGRNGSMLSSRAQLMNFRLVWQRTSMWYDLCASILWIFAAVTGLMYSLHLRRNLLHAALHFICLFIVIGVFLASMVCLLHVTNGLILMVDSYCCQLVHEGYRGATLRALTKEWNKVQAFLRRASAAMTHCMVIAQIVVVASASTIAWWMFFGYFDDPLLLLWIACPPFACVLMVAAHLFRAAQVTGRCGRLPAFINSHCEDENLLRAQLVEYTQSSAAGFYVFEVKLTGGTVMRLAYVVGIGTLTVLTRFAFLLKLG